MNPNMQLRMECLRLAAAERSETSDIVAAAEAYYQFVTSTVSSHTERSTDTPDMSLQAISDHVDAAAAPLSKALEAIETAQQQLFHTERQIGEKLFRRLNLRSLMEVINANDHRNSSAEPSQERLSDDPDVSLEAIMS